MQVGKTQKRQRFWRVLKDVKYTPNHLAQVARKKWIKKPVVAIVAMVVATQLTFPVLNSSAATCTNTAATTNNTVVATAADATVTPSSVAATTETPSIPEVPSIVTVSYPAGWNMVAVGNGVDLGTQLYAYNAKTGTYDKADPAVMGAGYWAFFSKETTVTMNMKSTGEAATELQAGWNMVGNPFDDDALVPTGYDAYVYKQATKQYKLTTTIPAGSCAWINSSVPKTITLKKETQTAPVDTTTNTGTGNTTGTTGTGTTTSTGSGSSDGGQYVITGATVNAADYGAKGDGSDSTGALQSALNASVGKTLVIPKGSTFVSGTLDVPSNVTIAGGGTIKKRAGSGRHLLRIGGKSNIAIHDVTLDGNASAFGFDEFHHIVWLAQSSKVTFDGVTFANPVSDGINVTRQPDQPGTGCADIVIKNDRFTGNMTNRCGVSVDCGERITISGNYFYRMGKDNMPGAIDFEPVASGDYSRDSVVENNTIVGSASAPNEPMGIALQNGNVYQHKNIKIIGNKITGKYRHGIVVFGGGTGIVIQGNTVRNIDSVISRDVDTPCGISTTNTQGTIQGNTVSDVAGYGIRCVGGSSDISGGNNNINNTSLSAIMGTIKN
ncbi:MAG TPA: right-handed parallel beta-helix repeat-containing protein [Candidatus Aquicultor sp.]|jgi:hypothetical protein